MRPLDIINLDNDDRITCVHCCAQSQLGGIFKSLPDIVIILVLPRHVSFEHIHGTIQWCAIILALLTINDTDVACREKIQKPMDH